MPTDNQFVESDQISLEIVDPNGKQDAAGLRLDTWRSYSFNQHFLSDTDGFSFTLGDESISNRLLAALVPWQKVKLYINGLCQATGLVDSVSISASHDGGTEVTIDGRNTLSPALDGDMDPRTQFQPSQTLNDLLAAVFQPLGFKVFTPDDDANRGIITGQTRGTPTTKKGKPLKSYLLHQLRPYPHENAFAFASRIANRFGLYLWMGVDGETIVCAKPAYDQDPTFLLRHKRGTTGAFNNVIAATVKRDSAQQPSVIIATGYGTGGEVPRQGLSLGVVNPVVDADNSAILNKYPNTRYIQTNFDVFDAVPNAYARPLFLHDNESKTEKQLEGFLRRELAQRMHRSFVYTAEVEKHTQDSVPWCVNTICQVDDDVCNVHERLWVMSRTFIKDRSGGTRTRVELIRSGSFDLGTYDQTS